MNVQLLSIHSRVPTRASAHAAGYDLYTPKAFSLLPGESEIIDLKIALEIAPGWFGKIESRSSLGFKHDVFAFGGVIDSDYRGSVNIKLFHLGQQPLHVAQGHRVAQLVLLPCGQVSVNQVEAVAPTARGQGGFGSTGK